MGHARPPGRDREGRSDPRLPGVLGRRYRLVATYDNPTGRVSPDGGMGEAGIGFTPDDPSEWPKLDTSDPEIARDLANLASFEDVVASD